MFIENIFLNTWIDKFDLSTNTWLAPIQRNTTSEKNPRHYTFIKTVNLLTFNIVCNISILVSTSTNVSSARLKFRSTRYEGIIVLNLFNFKLKSFNIPLNDRDHPLFWQIVTSKFMKHLLIPKKHLLHTHLLISFLQSNSNIVMITEVKVIVYYIFFNGIKIFYSFGIVIWFWIISFSKSNESDLSNLIYWLWYYSAGFCYFFRYC